MGLLSATTALEVGVFTGHSTQAMALALPPGGRVIACDERTGITRSFRTVDLPFVDADQESCSDCFQRCLELLVFDGLTPVHKRINR